MKIMLSLCCVTLAVLLHPTLSKNENQAGFRLLDTPQGEIGFTYFGSMAITTSEDFNAFLAEIAKEEVWGNRPAFVDALVNAKIDFDQEALVLLRYDKTHGGGNVPVEPPVLQGKALLVEIRHEPLRGAGLGVFTAFCYAFAVSKSVVDTVEFRVTGGEELRDPPILLFPTKYRRGLNFIRRDPPRKPANCPKLVLNCPTELIEKGKIVKLVVEGISPKDTVSYSWWVSDGQIVEGQGTSSLKIRINDANRFVTATVDIGGTIDPNCEHVFSCTFGIAK